MRKPGFLAWGPLPGFTATLQEEVECHDHYAMMDILMRHCHPELQVLRIRAQRAPDSGI